MLGIKLGNKGWAVGLIRQCEDQFGRKKEDDEGEGERSKAAVRIEAGMGTLGR